MLPTHFYATFAYINNTVPMFWNKIWSCRNKYLVIGQKVKINVLETIISKMHFRVGFDPSLPSDAMSAASDIKWIPSTAYLAKDNVKFSKGEATKVAFWHAFLNVQVEPMFSLTRQNLNWAEIISIWHFISLIKNT